MICKYQNKECSDRYRSESRGNLFCRLREWKRKTGVCPYDKNITNIVRINNKLDKNQTTLLDV